MSSHKYLKNRNSLVLLALISAVGVIAAAFVTQSCGGGPPHPDGLATPTPTTTNTPPFNYNANLSPTSTPTVAPSPADPTKLLEIIKEQQNQYVRKSYGQAGGQNFSDKNLDEFKAKGTPAIVAAELKTDNEFLDVVLAIKHMDATERQKLLNTGLKTYKQTWEEMGQISPAGQTEAGQEAEKLIAKAIVDLVKELYPKPDSEIKKP